MYGNSNFYIFLGQISAVSTLIPFVTAFIRKNNLSKELKILWFLIICSIITEIAGLILAFVYIVNNAHIFNIYVIIETLLISSFYYFVIQNRIWKLICIFLAIMFSVFAIIQLFLNPVKTLNNLTLTTESLMVIIFSVITFHYLIKYPKYKNILSTPIFWINSAFLLYFSGNLFLHLFSHFLTEYAQKAFLELWGFHSVFNIIFYTLISIGFWKTKTSQI